MTSKSRNRDVAGRFADRKERLEVFMAELRAGYERAVKEVEENKLRSQAARLASEPDKYGLTVEGALALVKAKHREAAAQTEAERRAAAIEGQSILRVPVRKIAAELGLSYGYVVQVRRKLGLSKARPGKNRAA